MVSALAKASWVRFPGLASLWLEFVVGSLLDPRVFSLGTLVFPSPQKPTFETSTSGR